MTPLNDPSVSFACRAKNAVLAGKVGQRAGWLNPAIIPAGSIRRFASLIVLLSAIGWSVRVTAHDPPAPPDFHQRVANLIRQLAADKFKDREAATRALEAAGPAALEQLRQATKTTDLEIARRAAAIIPVIERNAEIESLIQVVAQDPEWNQRRNAAEKLGQHGKHAAHAFPALLAATRDKYGLVAYAAILALGRVDAERAIPKLIDIVQGPLDYSVLPYCAAIALGEIGPPAGKAVPALVEALACKEKLVRREAARALGRIGGDDPKLVPSLLTALRDSAGEVRLQAVVALGRVKQEPADCVPALIELLNRQKPPDGTAVLPPEQEESFRAAIQAVGHFGADAKEVVPILMNILRVKNYINGVHLDAIAALEHIGPAAKESVPLLRDLAEGRLYQGVYGDQAARALQVVLKPKP